jgi:hypothetical protein
MLRQVDLAHAPEAKKADDLEPPNVSPLFDGMARIIRTDAETSVGYVAMQAVQRPNAAVVTELMLGQSRSACLAALFDVQGHGRSKVAAGYAVRVVDGLVESAQSTQADTRLAVGTDGSRSSGSYIERAVVDDLVRLAKISGTNAARLVPRHDRGKWA